jgi:U5 small nuclear ribonucleoprotein component
MAGEFGSISETLVSRFSWDELSADSIMSFGPHNIGPNMLVDYSLGFETDKKKLNLVKNSLVQGFQWATREGPLCEEPIQNVKFRFMSG